MRKKITGIKPITPLEDKETFCTPKLPFLPFQNAVVKDVLEICQPIFKEFRVTLFSQTRAFHDGHFSSLMTSTELTEHYLERKYPIYYSLGKGIILEPGIYVAAYLENQPSQHKIRNELRNYFNVDHMVHVIEKNSRYDDMFSFATTPENYQMVNQFINNIDVVKHFIRYFKEQSAAQMKQANKIHYSLEHFDLNIEEQSTVCKTVSKEEFFNAAQIKKLHIATELGQVCISKREHECLKYSVMNYTLKEIAKFLNLSPRTVETYINNVKAKFNCNTRADLIDLTNKYDLL